MKSRFLKKNSLKTVLLLLFLMLSIVLIGNEVFDQVKLSKNREQISDLTNASLSRQALLTKIRKGCDYVQVNLLMYMFKNFDAKSALILAIMQEEIIKNDTNLLAYKKLITTPSENKLFQNLVKQRRLNSANRLAIIKLIENNKIEQAKIINSEVLFKSYGEFEQSESRLTEYVNSRDHA